MKKVSSIFFLAFLLTACGQSLEGTYSDESGMIEYKFESNGKVFVYANVMGIESEAELKYEIDGERLKIFDAGGAGNMIMKLNDDDSISGPMGIRLTKM